MKERKQSGKYGVIHYQRFSPTLAVIFIGVVIMLGITGPEVFSESPGAAIRSADGGYTRHQTNQGVFNRQNIIAQDISPEFNTGGPIFAGANGVDVERKDDFRVCGDQNNDGIVNILDVVIDLQISAGMVQATPTQAILSDLNQDKTISTADAFIALRHIVGLEPTLEECGPVEPGHLPLKVAFIADHGLGGSSLAVLQLIESEGADMLMVQGDLGYGNETDPQVAIDWDNMVTSVLGADFPVFASIGNHDLGNWTTYQQKLQERVDRIPDANCTGDLGVKSACYYQGLFFILSGAGTMGTGHDIYISEQLAQDSSVWRVCSWHKNQREMQVGSQLSEVGWGPYEECRRGRAIIATGHEHSYHRTKTLISTEFQTVDPLWPDANALHVGSDSTFVFVSGLGGVSIRNQARCLPTTPPYGCNGEWANINTIDQGADFGALFMTFNVDGDPNKATGYFKEISGGIVDSFTVTTAVVNQLPTASFTFNCTTLDCTFDADGSSDPDGTIASYSWDFGDGSSGSGVTANHTYAASGTHNVVLTVTDDEGATDTETHSVTLIEAPTTVNVGDIDGTTIGIGKNTGRPKSCRPSTTITKPWYRARPSTASGAVTHPDRVTARQMETAPALSHRTLYPRKRPTERYLRSSMSATVA